MHIGFRFVLKLHFSEIIWNHTNQNWSILLHKNPVFTCNFHNEMQKNAYMVNLICKLHALTLKWNIGYLPAPSRTSLLYQLLKSNLTVLWSTFLMKLVKIHEYCIFPPDIISKGKIDFQNTFQVIFICFIWYMSWYKKPRH